MEMTLDLRDFRCLRCGHCCTVPGIVRVSSSDCEAAAAFLGITAAEFIERWAVLAPDRASLALVDGEQQRCCFFDEVRGCRINPAKPQQCRNFPRYWRNPGWEEYCAGAQALRKRTNHPDPPHLTVPPSA